MLAGPSALNSCSRCLISVPSSHFSAQRLFADSLRYTTRRFRSSKPPRARQRALAAARNDGPALPSWSPSNRGKGEAQSSEARKPRRKLNLSVRKPDKTIAHFEREVSRWSQKETLHERLAMFGIPKSHIQPLLKLFVSEVEAQKLSTEEAYNYYCLERFARSSSETDYADDYSDVVYTSIFYAWASNPNNKDMLEAIVPPSTILAISRLYHAANSEYPGDRYVEARSMRRKVIMHVGPTNSGKTHNALRALAAANSGVYAGPLRLLAHEIWERLNLGQIVPLGVEEEPARASAVEADTNSALDVTVPPSPDASSPAPALRSTGNPKYRRNCNMLTGEEHKIVEEDAPLLSCTVEMISPARKFDVAVIDEIQMIGDSERGYAWTNALLGVCAKEVHLCGEETAVPIVEALLKDTHDELVVNRYERLTPLLVGDTLEGTFKNVQKGDCIVTFSRKNVFAIKQKVEELTGLRCAVVYGGLPPEIRSEQAALFNDPDSGYDVIIGSDAIGMGLNLKIRRIVFECIAKFDGTQLRSLSLSQTKQIAGRAGRFGQLQEQRGYVTTLRAQDVGFVSKALKSTPGALPTARLGPDPEHSRRIMQALPPNASIEAIYKACAYVSKTKPFCRYAISHQLGQIAAFIDQHAPDLPLEDRVLFVTAPIPWREPEVLPFVESLLSKYVGSCFVTLSDCLKNMDYGQTLEAVEADMNSGKEPSSTPETLSKMEYFHRLLGLYNWLSFRQPVPFSDTETVGEVKIRVEKALQWCLKGTTRLEQLEYEEEPEEDADSKEKIIKFQSLDDIRKKKLDEAMKALERRKRMVPVQA